MSHEVLMLTKPKKYRTANEHLDSLNTRLNHRLLQ